MRPGRARGSRATERGRDLVPARREGGFDGLEETTPAVDLVRWPDAGSPARPSASGSSACSAAIARAASSHPLGDELLVVVSAPVEEWLERGPVDEGHDEQRRHVRWISGVLPQDLRDRDRGRGEGARKTLAWRSTSRLRTGGTPAAATFTTTRRASWPATAPE